MVERRPVVDWVELDHPAFREAHIGPLRLVVGRVGDDDTRRMFWVWGRVADPVLAGNTLRLQVKSWEVFSLDDACAVAEAVARALIESVGSILVPAQSGPLPRGAGAPPKWEYRPRDQNCSERWVRHHDRLQQIVGDTGATRRHSFRLPFNVRDGEVSHICHVGSWDVFSVADACAAADAVGDALRCLLGDRLEDYIWGRG